MLALTFDDGPGPSSEALLDVLRDAGIAATFFLLGRNLDEAPWCGDPARARRIARRMASEGHVLGNHSYSHLRPDRWREVADDVRRGEASVRALLREAAATGPQAAGGAGTAAAAGPPAASEPAAPGESRIPFRLPYGVRLVEQTLQSPSGSINAVLLDPRLPVIASLGLCHQHWTADFDDWSKRDGDGPALAAAMIAHVEQCAALGLDAVLDLHDSGTGSSFGYERPATVEGVRLLLAEAGRRGWNTFTVPQ